MKGGRRKGIVSSRSLVELIFESVKLKLQTGNDPYIAKRDEATRRGDGGGGDGDGVDGDGVDGVDGEKLRNILNGMIPAWDHVEK